MDIVADGAVWLGHGAWQDVLAPGVHRFDGSTRTRYLPDLTVYDLGIAPDGSVWSVPPRGGPLLVSVVVRGDRPAHDASTTRPVPTLSLSVP